MSKKIIAVTLALIIIIATFSFVAVAENKHQLAFDENGEFTILNICDIQDGYPMSQSCAQYIREVLAEYKPDLVVLGGDNTVAGPEYKEAAIKEICELFVESKTYFTLVFGNHDAENNISRDEQFNMYLKYGGDYCLAYDADKSLTGVGTHNLTVMSSDGSRIAYNIYMFDSNMYVYDEKGKELGYDCVNPDQIQWYKETSQQLKENNGGRVVPAMAFQHIAVQEADEILFIESPIPLGIFGKNCDSITYTYFPEFWNIKEGVMLEIPAAGYYNYGQFDAMVEMGDVEAIYFGHDHINDYVIEKDGIEMINTPSCTFNSYYNDSNRGSRLITVYEDESVDYKTEIILVGEQALKPGSKIMDYGELTIHQARASILGFNIGRIFMEITHYIVEEVIPVLKSFLSEMV